MTDTPARPTDDGGHNDATIPIVPEAGYAPTEQLPFAEDTLVDPAGPGSLWSADSGLNLSAPGYGEPYATPPQATQAPPSPQTGPQQPPAAPVDYPRPEAYPTTAAYTPPSYAQPQTGYGQTGYGQTGYGQTGYGQPAPQTNYVQPQVGPQPMPYRPAPVQGFAEPAGPADSIGTQNIYQGYPTAPSARVPQQPAWPAVIHDPVSYDYGYNASANLSEHPNAVLSLVLGIIGLLFLQVLSPVAWYVAAKGKRQMAESPGRWRPSGTLTAGLVLGIIGTIFLGLAVAFIVGMIMLMIAST